SDEADARGEHRFFSSRARRIVDEDSERFARRSPATALVLSDGTHTLLALRSLAGTAAHETTNRRHARSRRAIDSIVIAAADGSPSKTIDRVAARDRRVTLTPAATSTAPDEFSA